MKNKTKYIIVRALSVFFLVVFVAAIVIFTGIGNLTDIRDIVIFSTMSCMASGVSAIGFMVCTNWIEYFKRHLDE